ncbi:MAG: succinate--CoA ligase subunit beta, partial [Bdellovibrionales bacterium]|nr:succinate--CoA ligase subunit beta [Bdellovibrionales bacterium]
MEIHEYQAKALFQQSDIKVLDSQVVDSPEQAFQAAKSIKAPAWVIKAQVHAGGRGLAGGIKKASTPEEVQQ